MNDPSSFCYQPEDDFSVVFWYIVTTLHNYELKYIDIIIKLFYNMSMKYVVICIFFA